jgi:hypothetical protein
LVCNENTIPMINRVSPQKILYLWLIEWVGLLIIGIVFSEGQLTLLIIGIVFSEGQLTLLIIGIVFSEGQLTLLIICIVFSDYD